MERCPLCRATLNGATTCRRCKAELQSVQQAERDAQDMLGAALYRLAVGDVATSRRLARRALASHTTAEAEALYQLLADEPLVDGLLAGEPEASGEGDGDPSEP